jgi:hypothetical protein
MARGLRRWLKVAGVCRAELHKGDAQRKPLTWHDLRATGLTWLAIRGDDPLKIKQRAGHAAFSTTEIYVREAEAVREAFDPPFPSLPVSLQVSRFASEDSPMQPKRSGFMSGTRVSNSRPSAWEADALPTELVPPTFAPK